MSVLTGVLGTSQDMDKIEARGHAESKQEPPGKRDYRQIMTKTYWQCVETQGLERIQ